MIDGSFLGIQRDVYHEDHPGCAQHLRVKKIKLTSTPTTAQELFDYYSIFAAIAPHSIPDPLPETKWGLKAFTFFKRPDFEVDSLQDAERIFMREIESRKTVEKYDADCRDEFKACPLSTFIVRRCNLIASRTRRGPGNIVLVSADIWEGVDALLRNPPWPWTPHPGNREWAPAQDDGRSNTRFQYQGLINNEVEVYSTSFMPSKAVAVLYGGHFADGGGVYLEQDGRGFLSLNEGAEDYIEFFDIVGLPEASGG